jgi:hypothetical protein
MRQRESAVHADDDQDESRAAIFLSLTVSVWVSYLNVCVREKRWDERECSG